MGNKHKAAIFIPQDLGANENGDGSMLLYYIGNDSSLFYFSADPKTRTPNDSLVRRQKYVLQKRLLSDSVSFWGKDGIDTYWKEIIHKEVVYGYAKVPGKKKIMFDRVLHRVKIK